MKNMFTAKSSARKSDTVSGHTSNPYNCTGKHLLLITYKVTSSETVLPIFGKNCICSAMEGAFSRLRNTLKKYGLYYKYA